jgi:hypothetical protein
LNYYKKRKEPEPRAHQIVVGCYISALVSGICLVNLPAVYIVNEMKETNEVITTISQLKSEEKLYEKKIIIGFYHIKLDNGDRVTIEGSCVVNNSSRILYVESVKYSTFPSYYNDVNYVEKITPYSVYKGHIDYAFNNPPKSITEKKGTSKVTSKVKKWLRY